MSDTAPRPTGHLQVKLDWNGHTRSFWVFWRDQNDEKGGCRLGADTPVRDRQRGLRVRVRAMAFAEPLR
jgi:hypothetical protein